MAKIHDKFVIELAEVIKGYGNDPDVDDPFHLSEFYRFYELPEIAVSANHFKTMIPLEVVEKNAQPGWIPVTEKCPEIGQIVLCSLKTRHYYGRIHVCKYRAADKYYDHSYFDWNHNGFPDVVAWMPLPTPYREGGQDG